MLIIGAKGHAKEILHVLTRGTKTFGSLVFFDNISWNSDDKIYGMFNVLTSFEDVSQRFDTDNEYALGIGGPSVRQKLALKMNALGGRLVSIICSTAEIGKFDVELGQGLNIMSHVFISNSVRIGEGALINRSASIHHDCTIGSYCEIGPNAQVLGGANVDDFTMIGAGAIVLPKVNVGKHCNIGAGAVVTKAVPDHSVVVGVPALPIQKLRK